MYTDEKRTYRRVVGGIAWPGDFPGFAVAIGAEIYPAVGSKDHHLYVLAEVEESDVYTLFKRSVELAARYHVSCFYGRYDQAMINSLNLWNRNSLEKRTAVFNFDSAVFSNDGKINYHLNVTKSLLLPERKILHLSDVIESKLPAHIQSLPPNVYATATDIEYPAVAALGYAVTLLVEFSNYDYEEEKQERYVDDICSATGY